MNNFARTEIVSTLAALPFINRIWLFGTRSTGRSSAAGTVNIAIDCPNADASEWHQVETIFKRYTSAAAFNYVRWDKLENCAPLRQKICSERALVHEARITES